MQDSSPSSTRRWAFLVPTLKKSEHLLKVREDSYNKRGTLQSAFYQAANCLIRCTIQLRGRHTCKTFYCKEPQSALRTLFLLTEQAYLQSSRIKLRENQSIPRHGLCKEDQTYLKWTLITALQPKGKLNQHKNRMKKSINKNRTNHKSARTSLSKNHKKKNERKE